MSKSNFSLTINLVYEDSFNRFTNYEDCEPIVLADVLKRLSALQEEGWTLEVTSEDGYRGANNTKVTILSKPKDSDLWCKHSFIFIRKEIKQKL